MESKRIYHISNVMPKCHGIFSENFIILFQTCHNSSLQSVQSGVTVLLTDPNSMHQNISYFNLVQV